MSKAAQRANTGHACWLSHPSPGSLGTGLDLETGRLSESAHTAASASLLYTEQ